VLIAEESTESTANRIASLVVALIPGADSAGLSLVRAGKIYTFGATDQIVNDVDALQYATGEGPCLSSIGKQETFQIPDMTTDTTWPSFSQGAADAGVRGLLSFVLRVDDSLAALNIYSNSTDAFTEQDKATGAIFATQAAFTLANALTHEGDLKKADEMQAGLDTRGIIGQAMGILMEREGISSEEAFDQLRTASQHLNRKLRDVAGDLIAERGEPKTQK
jgi:hypothetical protein